MHKVKRYIVIVSQNILEFGKYSISLFHNFDEVRIKQIPTRKAEPHGMKIIQYTGARG